MSALPPTISDASVTLTFGTAGQYYGYCTIADVDYEFANLAGFTTMNSSVKAQAITYAGLELQESLDNLYVMPYTGADLGILTTLRLMNAKLAAAKLIERYFTGAAGSPNHSEAAMVLRGEVHERVVAIDSGIVRWSTPFGDATARAKLPVYNRATGLTITPNPQSGDTSATPIFTIGRDQYRKDDQI